jgi:hypothetical protein
MIKSRYIQKEDSEFIQNEIATQFLGLWAKLVQEGIPADNAKRGMAFALFKTIPHLIETRNLGEDEEWMQLIRDVGDVLEKYDNKGMHYGRISAGLEFLITKILGTWSLEDKYDD